MSTFWLTGLCLMLAAGAALANGPAVAAKKCFAVASPSQCAKIQDAGDEIQEKIRKIDELLYQTIARSMVEGSQIMNGTLAMLKARVTPMKISPPQVPIESPKVQESQRNITATVHASILAANRKIYDVIVSIVRTMTDDNDAVAQTTFKSSGVNGIGHVISSGSKLGVSVDGIADDITFEVRLAVIGMSQHIFDAFSTIFVIFTESLKALLAGRIAIDFDLVVASVNGLLKQAAISQALSTTPRLMDVIKVIVNDLDDVNSLTQKYHQDQAKLKDVLEPAASLMKEAIDEAETGSDHDDAGVVSRYVGMLVQYYKGIKGVVSS